MKKILATAAVGVALALALTGCSDSQLTSAATSTASAAATPTPSPTPTAMSIDEAGKYLLGTLCPVNNASKAANDALVAQDLAAVQSSAKALLPAAQDAARRLDDGTVIWPSVIETKDRQALRDYYLQALGPINTLATASSIEAASAVTFPDNTNSGAAAQTMRLRLNLSADTSEGC